MGTFTELSDSMSNVQGLLRLPNLVLARNKKRVSRYLLSRLEYDRTEENRYLVDIS